MKELLTNMFQLTWILTLVSVVGTMFFQQVSEQVAHKQPTVAPLPLPTGRDLQKLRDGRSYRHLEATQKFPVEQD